MARGSQRGESDHTEAARNVWNSSALFSEEERKELQTLLVVYASHVASPDTIKEELLQAAPTRQPEWWRQMFLSEYPERRMVAEWAVRSYGALIKQRKERSA